MTSFKGQESTTNSSGKSKKKKRKGKKSNQENPVDNEALGDSTLISILIYLRLLVIALDFISWNIEIILKFIIFLVAVFDYILLHGGWVFIALHWFCWRWRASISSLTKQAAPFLPSLPNMFLSSWPTIPSLDTICDRIAPSTLAISFTRLPSLDISLHSISSRSTKSWVNKIFFFIMVLGGFMMVAVMDVY
jgi:hypothetical protein